MNRSTPRGLTADTRLSPNRFPVAGTTGVWPCRAHVVPAWLCDRTPASSAKKICAPRREGLRPDGGKLDRQPLPHPPRHLFGRPPDRPLGRQTQ